jgi:hypothetical protein
MYRTGSIGEQPRGMGYDRFDCNMLTEFPRADCVRVAAFMWPMLDIHLKGILPLKCSYVLDVSVHISQMLTYSDGWMRCKLAWCRNTDAREHVLGSLSTRKHFRRLPELTHTTSCYDSSK